MPAPKLHARLLAEFVGTATLIAAGLGIALHGGDLLAAAIAQGLAIAIMVTAVGHVSGGHFNPAVSVAMLALRRITPVDALMYVAAQLAGAVAAAGLIKSLFGDLWQDAIATVALGKGVSVGQGFGLEALTTFFLVWVVFAVAVDVDGAYSKVAGLPIGFAVVMDILMVGPLTGATMNPARWFGPNLITGDWSDAVVWIAGPVFGGLIAGFAYVYGVRPRLSADAA